MVHKKYIKRGDKIFGPYLYQNYRENGITKTRYLGIGKEKKERKWVFIFGIIALVIIILSFSIRAVYKKWEMKASVKVGITVLSFIIINRIEKKMNFNKE